MLSLANIDITDTYREFKKRQMRVTFLVPTAAGLDKSIMDATVDVRDFFHRVGVHDFSRQEQGQDHKKVIETVLISQGARFLTTTSLYRPQTKQGDPRIWVSDLKKHAQPGDLLAVGVLQGKLLVINCSTTDLQAYLDLYDSEARGLRAERVVSSNSEELIAKLRGIAAKGFVPTMRPGDTGVGFTLESLLGIAANSSKRPDYKGIELKASRSRTAASGQSTVFSQVPDWKISRLKGSREVLEERGQYNVQKKRNQLFHEISAKSPNSYGLQLELDDDYLKQVYVPGTGNAQTDVVWRLEKLKQRLTEKHKETMWVVAETEGKGTDERFLYTGVKHAKGVDPNALPILLGSGAITVHYLIKETPSGGAKDQGYLFKTSSKNLDLLFSSVDEYRLVD